MRVRTVGKKGKARCYVSRRIVARAPSAKAEARLAEAKPVQRQPNLLAWPEPKPDENTVDDHKATKALAIQSRDVLGPILPLEEWGSSCGSPIVPSSHRSIYREDDSSADSSALSLGSETVSGACQHTQYDQTSPDLHKAVGQL